MALRLNGSTSGYVELNAPAVAPSTSLEIPKLGFGKILQVKHANSTTTVSGITSDTLLLSVSITPLSSTSKILVIGNSYAYVLPSSNAIGCSKLRAHTSATATAGTQIGTACFGSDSGQTFYASQKVQSVHTPGNTNTIVYSLVQGKGSQNTNYVDAEDYSIFAMEVES